MFEVEERGRGAGSTPVKRARPQQMRHHHLSPTLWMRSLYVATMPSGFVGRQVSHSLSQRGLGTTSAAFRMVPTNYRQQEARG